MTYTIEIGSMNMLFICMFMKYASNFLNICIEFTLFENENEWQKTDPVLIQLPMASRNFPNVKTRNQFFFYNWTSETIPLIRLGKQMERT